MTLFSRNWLSRKSLPADTTPVKRRKLVAKRRKAPRGTIRIDPGSPILEQARQCR